MYSSSCYFDHQHVDSFRGKTGAIVYLQYLKKDKVSMHK